jgi:hypothetical protein
MKKVKNHEFVSLSEFYIYHLRRYRTNLRFTFCEPFFSRKRRRAACHCIKKKYREVLADQYIQKRPPYGGHQQAYKNSSMTNYKNKEMTKQSAKQTSQKLENMQAMDRVS